MDDFNALVEQLPDILIELKSSEPIEILNLPTKPKISGVYVFYEGDKPIYVGRTKHLRQRLKSHYNITNHNMGSFVFLMACKNLGRVKASYKSQGSRKELHGDEGFRCNYLLPAHERLKKMLIRFVEIKNPNLQHLFEIYAALSLKTQEFNSFETH